MLSGLLTPDTKEEIIGHAEVRDTFKSSKFGTIAGCFVTDGIVQNSAKIRLVREGKIIHEGEVGTLKRFKDDVKEVRENYECGISFKDYSDILEKDEIEFYVTKEVQKNYSVDNKPSFRTKKVELSIKRLVSEYLVTQKDYLLKFPTVRFEITEVKVSKDLRFAKIYLIHNISEEDFKEFKIPENIYLTSLNYDTGIKSDVNDKNIIIEALKFRQL